jgi:ABC-type antimicrobial peptide transport system permease subunit
VAVVNETFAQQFFGATSPIGQEVVLGREPRLERFTIVGMVNDAMYRTVRTGVPPTLFVPIAQAGPLSSGFSLTVETAGSFQSTIVQLREALSRTDARLAFSFRDYADQLGASIARERLVAMLSGFFGGLALLLAGLGLYGVTSYSVQLRRPEMAVRMALGANAGGIERLVLRRVGGLVAAGVIAGVGISLWVTTFVRALLFNVDARDPLTFVAAVVTLAAVAFLAGWLPARRAARLDPNVVLRN